MTTLKQADLAGPGTGTYEEIERVLPTAYESLLDPKQTQFALHELKRYISDHLCRELNLFPVEVSVTVWPDELKRICAKKNIHVLE